METFPQERRGLGTGTRVRIKGKVEDGFNPYRDIVNAFGKEDKETTFSTPFGATSIREWKDKGITLVRRVEYEPETNTYVLIDEVDIPRKYSMLISKMQKSKKLLKSVFD